METAIFVGAVLDLCLGLLRGASGARVAAWPKCGNAYYFAATSIRVR
jgi:hypothetical protein